MKSIITLILLLLVSTGLKANNINTYEYWFDNDYNSKVSNTSINDSIYIFNQEILTNGLAEGLHFFNMRFKDDSSRWSQILTKFFYNKPYTNVSLSAYEYWFDENYSAKKSFGASGDAINFNEEIDMSAMDNGLHIFNFRAKDSLNRWSAVRTQFVYKSNRAEGTDKIASYRYWYDDDTTKTSVDLAPPTSPYLLLKPFTVPANYAIGSNHVFNIQFKSTSGLWSGVVSKEFWQNPQVVLNYPQNSSAISKGADIVFNWTNIPNAAKYEIWIDNNSGFGSPEIGFNNGKSLQWQNNGIVNTNSFTLTSAMQNNLPQNVYYWKVRAYNTNNTTISEFSGAWNFSLLDSGTRIATPIVELSKAQILLGDSILISGRYFSKSKKIKIEANLPDYSIVKDSIQTDNDGFFTYKFLSSAYNQVGEYSFAFIDSNSYIKSSIIFVKSDKIENDTIAFKLEKKDYYVLDYLKVEFTDIIKIRNSADLLRLDSSKSKLYYEYQLKYSLDTGKTWENEYLFKGYSLLNTSLTQTYFIRIDSNFNGYIPVKIVDNLHSKVSASPSINNYYSKIAYLPSDRETIDDFIKKNKSVNCNVSFHWCMPSQLNNLSDVKGVAADGVSPILIRLNIYGNYKDIYSVKCELIHANQYTHAKSNNLTPELLGKIMYKPETSKLADVKKAHLTSSVAQNNNKSNYDFWYVAPLDYVIDDTYKESSDRYVIPRFIIIYLNGAIDTLDDKSIQICRPPLMFVHGLNSNSTMWKKMLGLTSDDVSEFGDGSFILPQERRVNDPTYHINQNFKKYKLISIPNMDGGLEYLSEYPIKLLGNKKSKSFQSIQQKMADSGFSALQVDYLSHSMGSLMLRKTIQDKNYLSLKYNLKYGYVHKMLSIDSPHNGSILANVLEDFCNYYNGRNKDETNLSQFLVLPNMALTVDGKQIHTAPAEFDMQVDEISNNFETTKVRNHLIASNYFTSAPFAYNYKLDIGFSSLLHLMEKVNYINAKYVFNDFWENDLANLNNVVNKYLISKNKNNLVNWFLNSDMIVGVSSQLAGKTLDKTIRCFSGFGHTLANPVTEQDDVRDHISTVLDSKIADGYFSDYINQTNFSKPASKPINNFPTNSSIIQNDSTLVELSVEKDSISIGDNIFAKIRIKDSTNFNYSMVEFQGLSFYLDSGKSEYSFILPIDSKRLDENLILSTTQFIKGDTIINCILSKKINFIINDSLVSFKAKQRAIELSLNNKTALNYTAFYNKFSLDLESNSNLITHSIADTSVLSIDSSFSQINFKGINAGSTFVVSTYQNLKDTIYFEVVAPKIVNIEQPQLLTPSDKDSVSLRTVNFVWYPIKNISTYYYQIALDSNFDNLFIEDIIQSDTVYSLSTLTPNTKYFWRVKAVGEGGESEWSSVWAFYKLTPTPSAPTVIYPLNNKTINKNYVIGKWNKPDYAAFYETQISKDSTFTNNVSSFTNITKEFSQFSNLNDTSDYFWRVRAGNSTGLSEWTKQSFNTKFIDTSGYTLSGNIKYKNSSQSPMNNSQLALINSENQIIDIALSDTLGAYTLKNVPNGAYRLELSTTKARAVNCMNIQDVAQLRMFVGQVLPFDTLQIKVSNVNMDTKNDKPYVNIQDVSVVRMRNGGLFPTTWIVPDWLFAIETAPNIFKNNMNVIINSANQTVNIKALCSGDVNGSFIPAP